MSAAGILLLRTTCLFVTAVMLFGGQAAGQTPHPACAPFLAARHWKAQFSITGSGNNSKTHSDAFTTTTASYGVSQSVQGSFEIPGGLPVNLKGGLIATRTATVNDRSVITQTSRVPPFSSSTTTTTFAANQNTSVTGGTFELESGCSRYRFSIGSVVQPATMTVVRTHSDDPRPRVESRTVPYFIGPVDRNPIEIMVDWTPVTSGGTTLTGTATVTGIAWVEGAATWTLTWRIEPAPPEDLQLVLISDAYHSWLPEAYIPPADAPPVSVASSLVNRAADDVVVRRGGNHLDFRAEVQRRDGTIATIGVRRFIYDLSDISNEPGKSMNFPVLASDADDDLAFTPTDNPHLTIMSKGRHAESVVPFVVPVDNFRVTSYDYGACGVLRVKAELSDGRILNGHLKGYSATSILVPRRKLGSCVGDTWREANGAVGLADNDDSDRLPLGDGHNGDGFTLYEEYRGWVAGRKHLRGKPDTKELFVRVEDAATVHTLSGIPFYSKLTGIRVYSGLFADEFPASRVMNANFRAQAHAYIQHGLRITLGTLYPRIVPELDVRQTPRQVDSIELLPLIAPQRGGATVAAFVQKTVAHELLHATGVLHHGEENVNERWILYLPGSPVRDPGLAPRIWRDGVGWIEYLTEKAPHLPLALPLDRLFESRPGWGGDSFAMPFRPPLGLMHGLHSGDQNCVMTYQFANTYRDNRKPNRFFYFEYEPFSYNLCTSPVGSVGNAAGHLPQPRFSHAFPGRGSCSGQVCVNDRDVH